MASEVEDEIEIGLLVPLGFIILTVWTATWGQAIVRLIRGDKKPAPSSTEEPEPAVEKSKKSKSKKKSSDALGSANGATTAAAVPAAPAAGPSDKWKALVLLVAWVVFLIFLASDYGMGKLNTGRYDPYKILNVPESVSKSELKRLYRDLSKEYHPDRLSGKPEADRKAAEARFMQISKAYKTLTTEEMMNNWLEYGHPDGPRSLSISTGLPSWMKKQENAWFIMLGYLGVFGGIGYFLKSKLSDLFAEEPDDEKAKSN